jgi:ATP synthase protein I
MCSPYNAPPSMDGPLAMHNFPIYRAIACQALVWLVSVVLAILFLGLDAGFAVALGGLISLLPGCWFTVRYFRYSGARSMEQVVRNAYVGEVVKLVQMGAGFALVFALARPLNLMAVIGGFLVVQVAGILIAASVANTKPV